MAYSAWKRRSIGLHVITSIFRRGGTRRSENRQTWTATSRSMLRTPFSDERHSSELKAGLYPLRYKFAIWYTRRTLGVRSQTSYEDNIKKIVEFSTVALLEWADDLEVFILKGYGNSLNYKTGVPLGEDVLHSMEEAIKAREENLPPGSYEKSSLGILAFLLSSFFLGNVFIVILITRFKLCF